MRKAKNCNKKRSAIVLTGTLALTGVVSAIPMPMLGNPLAAAVYAADATNYSTVLLQWEVVRHISILQEMKDRHL